MRSSVFSVSRVTINVLRVQLLSYPQIQSSLHLINPPAGCTAFVSVARTSTGSTLVSNRSTFSTMLPLLTMCSPPNADSTAASRCSSSAFYYQKKTELMKCEMTYKAPSGQLLVHRSRLSGLRKVHRQLQVRSLGRKKSCWQPGKYTAQFVNHRTSSVT